MYWSDIWMVGLIHRTQHLNQPFEYWTIGNLNFKKFGIQMVGIQVGIQILIVICKSSFR